VRAAFGACNVLCAHVGGAIPGRFDQLGLDVWRDALETGVVGTVATVQAFLPLMRATTGLRRIVLTSSVAALAPGRFQGPYRAAKAAVTSIGETLELELGEEGIGTTIVFPSGMVTPEVSASLVDADAIDDAMAGLPPEFREVARTLREELAADPSDLATGHEAAGPVIEAVLAGAPYVITHGATVEAAHRVRQERLERAFADLRGRGYGAGRQPGEDIRSDVVRGEPSWTP
jgi:NAD(P)-dependent dehydrogenase (short-subunit alcohol dehydrogenase family)